MGYAASPETADAGEKKGFLQEVFDWFRGTD
jgi:hypothetical protein